MDTNQALHAADTAIAQGKEVLELVEEKAQKLKEVNKKCAAALQDLRDETVKADETEEVVDDEAGAAKISYNLQEPLKQMAVIIFYNSNVRVYICNTGVLRERRLMS